MATFLFFLFGRGMGGWEVLRLAMLPVFYEQSILFFSFLYDTFKLEASIFLFLRILWREYFIIKILMLQFRMLFDFPLPGPYGPSCPISAFFLGLWEGAYMLFFFERCWSCLNIIRLAIPLVIIFERCTNIQCSALNR